MATEAQIQANRMNSMRATGPKTEEGKAKSSANAMKHGLSGEGVVLPESLREAIDQRMAEWFDDSPPQTTRQGWLARRICVESIRIDICELKEASTLRELALRSQESWDDDRKLEALLLFEKLPQRPEIVQRQLLRTKQGCDALISDWSAIYLILKSQEGWTPEVWNRALNLLGMPLADRSYMTPSADENLEWVVKQIKTLEQLQANMLNERDQRDQILLETGKPLVEPIEIRNLRRYEAGCMRRLLWAWEELEAEQKGTRRRKPRSQPKSIRDLELDLEDLEPPTPTPSPSPTPSTTTPPRQSAPQPTPAPTQPHRPKSPAQMNRKERRAAQARAKAELKAEAKSQALIN